MEIYNRTHYKYREEYSTVLFLLQRITDALTHSESKDCFTPIPETDFFRFQRLTNSLLCIAFPLQPRAVPIETLDHGC
jgi:hypothetical protein